MTNKPKTPEDVARDVAWALGSATLTWPSALRLPDNLISEARGSRAKIIRDGIQPLLDIIAADRKLIEAQTWTLTELRAEIERAVADTGIRLCDTPACNCGGYHNPHAENVRELKAEIERLNVMSERYRQAARDHRDEILKEVWAKHYQSEIERLKDALVEISDMEDKSWKPVQVFRSDDQVAVDDIRHEVWTEAARIAKDALIGDENHD